MSNGNTALPDYYVGSLYYQHVVATANSFCTGDPASERYACQHTFDPTRQLLMIQDFSHNIKKLRNGVISSGTVQGKVIKYNSFNI